VVIETSAPVEYAGHLLKPEGDKPRRLYVDLAESQISKKLQKAIPVSNSLLQRIRSAQFKPGTVRVVLDTQSLSDYKVFSLENPYRIVVDVKGAETIPRIPPTEFVPIPMNAPSLAQQLGLGIKRVVLDPGHGGKDPGAVGVGGLLEKDIVLMVAKKVARKITTELGIEVLLTRKRDVYLRLEERTAIANTEQGDLFISIHANSAESPKASGVETYYLDLAGNESEMKIAAKENATAAQKIGDLQDILSSLMNNSKKNESAQLAGLVQTNLYKGLSKDFTNVHNHGVKKAPFIVLIGAQMPSILTEIAFISNPAEAKRLLTDQYLEAIADNITNGVVDYAVTLKVAGL
jgi:N-acetylmuramoyl-L-alanine amidase